MRSVPTTVLTSTRLLAVEKSKRLVGSLCQNGAQKANPRTRLIMKSSPHRPCLSLFRSLAGTTANRRTIDRKNVERAPSSTCSPSCLAKNASTRIRKVSTSANSADSQRSAWSISLRGLSPMVAKL